MKQNHDYINVIWNKITKEQILNIYLDKYFDIRNMALKILNNYSHLAIDIDDIMSEIFSKFRKICLLFDLEKQVAFEIFLFKYVKFYIKNICRSYSGNKYRVLNNNVYIDAEEIIYDESNKSHHLDAATDHIFLSGLNLKIYKYLIDDNLKANEIGKIMNWTTFEVNKILKRIFRILYS